LASYNTQTALVPFELDGLATADSDLLNKSYYCWTVLRARYVTVADFSLSST